MHMTVSGGVRESTARAYLRPVLNRPNLTLVTQARAHRIVLDGKRATGVVVSANNRPPRIPQRRSDPVGREYCLSGSSAALRYRESGPPRRHRYSASARITRGRRKSAGSSRGLLPIPLQATGYAEQKAWPVEQGTDWRTVAVIQRWPRGN